jgi:HEAT repeat protein
MSEQPSEIKKLIAIANDPELSPELRSKAVELIGNIGSRDAFLALLELAANEKLLVDERDLALKRAREIVKSGR